MTDEAPVNEPHYRQCKERRRRYFMCMAAFAGLVGLCLALIAGNPMSEDAYLNALRLFAIGFAGILAFHYLDWRCPACGKYITSSAGSRYCPECGCRLRLD